MITLIVAINEQRTIGLDGVMPWRNKEDLQHFKNYTMGKKVLMGRKTFDGLPVTLKGRDVFVVTRNKDYAHAILDLEEYLNNHKDSKEEIIVAGGGEIYKLAMPFADKIVLSIIKNNEVVGDTFFPEIDESIFKINKIQKMETFDRIYYERK